MTIRGSTGRIPSCVGDAVRYRTEYVGVQGPNLLEGDIDALVDAARDATLLDLTEERTRPDASPSSVASIWDCTPRSEHPRGVTGSPTTQ
jgi:hypothetical protein